MKVVHFIASIDKTGGGTTSYMKLLAEELAKFNFEQMVVSGLSKKPVEIKGVEVKFFESNSLTPFQNTRVKKLKVEYLSFLKKECPNLVHINGLWNYENSLFQKSAEELGIKVIISPHGMLEPYILNRNPLKKKLALLLYQNKSLKKAVALHATADTELKQIKKLGYNNESIIIPNGIETHTLPKKKWDNKLETTVKFLFLSRIHPKKGIDLLIKAVSMIEDTRIKVTIAGNGEHSYIEELKNLSVEYNVSDKFDFVGAVYGDKKWKLYCDSDVFVLPTHSENFGIVVAEALCIGIPVITTKGTPWSELDSEKCGWWVDLSLTNLVSSLKQALDLEYDDIKKMGENGINLIENKYTIQTVAKDMFRFYERCLNKN
ncbi:glycosyltransferase [Wenyingzhuangia sp. IMCC45574]